MRMTCSRCGQSVEWSFVAEHIDERGVKWEVYECTFCGERKRYAVG